MLEKTESFPGSRVLEVADAAGADLEQKSQEPLGAACWSAPGPIPDVQLDKVLGKASASESSQSLDFRLENCLGWVCLFVDEPPPKKCLFLVVFL